MRKESGAQVISCLKALRLPLALLKDGVKRVILSNPLGDLGVLAVQSGGAK
jgi:hypothetical protein